MLTVIDLHIEYPGKLVFDSVNFEAMNNEIIAIETQVLDGGTSLLRGIGGFLNGVGGEVNLEGLNLLDCSSSDRASKVGYVYEDHGLISLYTVYQNIILPLQFHSSFDDEQIHQRLTEVCRSLKLDEKLLAMRPHELNDVQTRLINLARALIIHPELLLIDEIEGGMSEEYLHVTMETLRERQQEHPMIIIITTSDDFVMEYSDRIYCIKDNDLVGMETT